MAEIYHMVRASDWAKARAQYEPASLAAEGFIHCTAGERNLMGVAERSYREVPGNWLVLVIDPALIRAEVRWVVQPDGMAYPHIHGPLNTDAVTEVCPFPRDAAGHFLPFRELP
jgi:uncharacterized protein (DUF952 family)